MKYAAALSEIQTERRTVGFDTYDITIKQLVDMVEERAIHISPDYQRKFVWDAARQSQLIESIYLGIPVPNLFMATNQDATWDVIDGLQRITTILRFVSPRLSSIDGEAVPALKLKGLEKTPSLNGATFEELPSNLKLSFMTRPMRITVLNDNSDFQVRFDLFERLNTGGIVLHEQEIRNCVFQGPFNDFLKDCAMSVEFTSVIKRSDKTGRGNVEELALKFFAYLEDRESFKHSVKDFLNDYMEKKSTKFDNKHELQLIFDQTFSQIHTALPQGIVRSNRPNSTPLVLFEAITVGVADMLRSGLQLDAAKLNDLLDDDQLKLLTTGATNSPPKLHARIDFVSENAHQ
ncbi:MULTISPECIES: DUF262 domain-containing protein [Phaeobacter]|uniref:GmrSD restriction endonuclease domain-containing protein n=1 Tax=Phaeobacter TaxID=302485 RepID=UPI00058B228B|nr:MULTISPECIES: DUF262 domain-containing protein [Phaeobacter]KII14089.1 hypothetical protein OO25_13735 [Phaeobacter sp. S60]UTS80898.1 hypothetical protein OL67_001969 [Phaeobacter piscinae]